MRFFVQPVREVLRHICPAAISLFLLTSTGCRHTAPREAWGFSTYHEDHREAFLRSELSRVAPKFGGNWKLITSQLYSDPKTGLILRSGSFQGTFVNDDEERRQHERVRFVRIAGKPLNNSRELELSAYVGHGGIVPVVQEPAADHAQIGISIGGRSVAPRVWNTANERLYRRRVVALDPALGNSHAH